MARLPKPPEVKLPKLINDLSKLARRMGWNSPELLFEVHRRIPESTRVVRNKVFGDIHPVELHLLHDSKIGLLSRESGLSRDNFEPGYMDKDTAEFVPQDAFTDFDIKRRRNINILTKASKSRSLIP